MLEWVTARVSLPAGFAPHWCTQGNMATERVSNNCFHFALWCWENPEMERS